MKGLKERRGPAGMGTTQVRRQRTHQRHPDQRSEKKISSMPAQSQNVNFLETDAKIGKLGGSFLMQNSIVFLLLEKERE